MKVYVGVCGVEHEVPDWVDVDMLTCMMQGMESEVLDGLRHTEAIMDALGDVPVDEDGRIRTGFTMTTLDGRTVDFGAGVRVEDIWDTIGAEYPVSVGRLMEGDE